MAADYTEPCWPDLERLAAHLGHLPLSALDLWRRLAHDPDGMVALALRMHQDLEPGFALRFARELPFAWEVVPLRAWRLGVQRLRRQCQAWFGEALAGSEVARHLPQALGDLTAAYPSLKALLGLVECDATGQTKPEIAFMRSPANDTFFRDLLFGGEDCALQRLRRAHAEETWPNTAPLAERIERERNNAGAISDLLGPLENPWQSPVIDTPLLLAGEVAASGSSAWLDDPRAIHAPRCVRAFDPDWFDEAFDRTIARCVARGLLDSG